MNRVRLQIQPTRAVGFLALVAVLTVAISVAFLLFNLRARELEHARIETISLTKVFMRQTEQNLESIDAVLKGVQERLQNPYGSQFELNSVPTHLLLNARAGSNRHLRSLFIVDAEGNVVNSSREQPLPPTTVLDRDYFKAFLSAENSSLFIDRPVRSRIDGTWNWHLARRLNSLDGKFRGLVVVSVNVAAFEQLYNYVKLDFERPFSIYLADGTLVASIPHRESQIGDRAPELGTDRLPVAGDDVRMLTHARGDGGRQGFALGHTDQFPMLVSVTNDEQEALYSWRETAWPIAAGAVLMCLLIIGAAGLLINELNREDALSTELSGANDRYHQTIDSVMDGIVAVDEAHKILVFNPAAERRFGLSASAALGSPLELLLPQTVAHTHRQYVNDFIGSGVASKAMGVQLDVTGRRSDGTEFPIESTVSQTSIGGKRQMTAVLRDVTERRRNEENLREMNVQLRQLSESLQTVREEERSRISRELHDELGQQLTGLKLEFSWLCNRLREGREVTTEELDGMRKSLDTALSSVRRISSELRPLILDDLGFADAVAWQAGEFSKRTGIATKLDLAGAKVVMDQAMASGLFRIIQESLTNIARHANASQVDISIRCDDKDLMLVVQDNGKGMANPERRRDGIGLISMRERAISMGGFFLVLSDLNSGTTIEVKLPLQLASFLGATV
ncbi:MAG: PAS domain S-box protein [Rhodoferax sp.]